MTSEPISGNKNIGFAVGTGRCGTTFFHEVVSREPEVVSSHCRQPLLETFHRYCRWNNLPVDDEGFLNGVNELIVDDLKSASFSFESSPYLSLSIQQLHSRFGSRFVLLVREPKKVVLSHVNKGWYAEPFIQANESLALGWQQAEYPHHYFGRIAPRGSGFFDWNGLSQVGKCAWYWATLNRAVIEQFAKLPDEDWCIQRLEDLDFMRYQELTEFLGFKSGLSAEEFKSIRSSKPNAQQRAFSSDDWTEVERIEYTAQISQLAGELGYE